MMELLMKDLFSSDVKTRLQALEKTYSKIQSKHFYKELHGDEKVKLVNECISTIKDPNPRIVLVGLQCIEHFIKTYPDDFQPYCNMTLQSLITRLGDNKENIRSQSMVVICTLIDIMGLAVGLDRLVSHLNNRNQKLKESILGLISRLQEIHGDNLKTCNGLISAITLTLHDSQSSVRQLAISTLVSLHAVFGDQLMETIMKHDIRPAQQKQLIDAIANKQHHLAVIYPHRLSSHKEEDMLTSEDSSGLMGSNIDDGGYDDLDPWSLIDNDDNEDEHNTIKLSLTSKQKRLSTVADTLLDDDVVVKASSTTGHTTRRSSTERRSMSAGTGTRRSSMGIHGKASTMRDGIATDSYHAAATTVATGHYKQQRQQMISAGIGELISSDAVSDDSAMKQLQLQPLSCFNPESFMPFLTMEKPQSPIHVIDDKDLMKQMGKIAVDLNKKADWQTRLNALIIMQRIAMGNMVDCKNCVELLRGMHESISSQVIDLRSAVSKEACRTISIIVHALKTHAYPLLELLWVHLLRVVVVKIQVISSSADRCIRIAVCCCTGESRLVLLITEHYCSKIPLLRRLCFEYLCLAVAVWRVDLIDKHITNIKHVLRQGLSDADPNVRRNARQLYWLLHQCCKSIVIQNSLKVLVSEIDAATLKHLNQEYSSTHSLDMQDLLTIHKHGLNYFTSKAYSDTVAVMNCSDRSIRGISTSSSISPRDVQTNADSCEGLLDLSDNLYSRSSHQSLSAGSNGLVADLMLKDSTSDVVLKQQQQQQPLGNSNNSSSSSLHSSTSTSLKPSKRLSLSGPMRVLTNAPSSSIHSSSTHAPSSSLDNRPQLIDCMDENLDSSNSSTANMMSSGSINNNNTSRGASSSQPSLLSVGPKRIIRNNNSNNVNSSATLDTTSTSSTTSTTTSTTTMMSTTHVESHATSASNETKANHPSVSTRPSTSHASSSSSSSSSGDIAAESSSSKKTTTNTNITNSSSTSISTSIGTSSIVPMDVFIFSAETLRVMAEDSSQWTSRLKAFEAINERLKRAVLTNEALNEMIIDSFIDISIPQIADPHHKVALEAISVIHACISSFSSLITNHRLGLILISLFQRLADRRQPIRDQSNAILNLIRTQIRPNLIFASLSPRMHEIPDRMKAALMQYLAAITPHCEEFFSQSQNTWAFLSRMAQIVGSSSGSKPSVTVTVAGRRLLELVYKTSPKMVCAQIVMLPYQQQITLKKLLETSVPDIDSLVLTASRSEWSSSTGNKSSSSAAASMMMMATNSSQPTMSSIQRHSTEPHSTSPPSSSSPSSSASPPSSSSPMLKIRSPVKGEEEERILYSMSYPSSSPSNDNHRTTTIVDKQHSLLSAANPVDLSTTARSNVGSDNSSSSSGQHPMSTYRDITSYTDDDDVAYSCLSPRHSHITVSKDVVDHDDAISSVSVVGKPASPIHHSFISNYESIKSDILSSSSSSSYSYQHQPKSSSSLSYHQPINSDVSSSPTYSPTIELTSSLTNYPAAQNTITSSSSAASLYPTLSSSQSNFAYSSSTLQNKTILTDQTQEQQQHPLVSTAVGRKPISPPLLMKTASEDNQVWLLESLHPSSKSMDIRQVASKELKALIKTASDNYWVRNYAQIVAVLLESYKSIAPHNSSSSSYPLVESSIGIDDDGMKSTTHRLEHEHVNASTKSLLLLMKYRGAHMKNVLELLVTRLCECAHLVPTVISQLFELILSEFAKYDALRLVAVILPYAGIPKMKSDDRQQQQLSGQQQQLSGEHHHHHPPPPQIRLLSLHVICGSIRFMTSSQLLDLLPKLITTILPSLQSAIADLRKSVIFILVEAYLSVGEALFPHIQTLTPPQRKLLTIYIEKKMADRSSSTDTTSRLSTAMM